MDNSELDVMLAQRRGLQSIGIREDSTPYYIHNLERMLNRIEYKLDLLLKPTKE